MVILVYVLAIFGTVFSGIWMDERGGALPVVLLVVSVVLLSLGWIPLCGLKVLKPQEALVLTLFGKYVGTLRDNGFYFVNPFCSSINPAARTRLSQSGDVRHGSAAGTDAGTAPAVSVESPQQEDLPEDHDSQQQPAEDQ